MNWLTTGITVLQMIPAIIAALKAIEEAIPGRGLGEQKIAAVREILTGVSAQFEVLWPAIEKTIAIIVGTFNKTGVFSK